MAANDSVRHLIDAIVACDEQPSEEQMTELRKTLEGKVATMKRRVRHSRTLCVAGIVLFVIGYILLFSMLGRPGQPGNPGQPSLATATAFGLVVVGAILAIFGFVGLFLFHGFGYVWARNDLHDAAIMELSLQVQRLADRIDTPHQNS
jgi:hypothetical protein